MTASPTAKKARKELSLDEQIDYLRRFGEAWPLEFVAVVSALVALASVYAFSQSSHVQLNVLLLFVAGVSSVLAAAIATQLPGWKRAARATRTGRRVRGSLELTVDRSDPEHVTFSGVMSDGSATWKLQFDRPFGWTPASGEWPCEMVLLSGEPVPALVELEQGVLLPNRQSRRTSTAAPGASG